MPNTLTSIFVSNPATEPVEAPHPNTGVYVTGTQATAGGPWTVVHTLITKTTTPLTMVGRLKNFPAVTVSVVASGGPNAGNIFNNILATPTGTAATATSSTAINVVVSSISNQTGYRLFASDTSAGTYTQIYQGTTASYPHTGLTSGQTKYYKWQYVGGGYYDDSLLSAVFSGVTGAAGAPPATPANLRQTATTTSTSTMAWDAVAGTYTLQRAPVSATNGVVGAYATVYTGTTASYADTALASGTGYAYQVLVTVNGTASAYSVAAWVVTASATATSQQPYPLMTYSFNTTTEMLRVLGGNLNSLTDLVVPAIANYRANRTQRDGASLAVNSFTYLLNSDVQPNNNFFNVSQDALLSVANDQLTFRFLSGLRFTQTVQNVWGPDWMPLPDGRIFVVCGVSNTINVSSYQDANAVDNGGSFQPFALQVFGLGTGDGTPVTAGAPFAITGTAIPRTSIDYKYYYNAILQRHELYAKNEAVGQKRIFRLISTTDPFSNYNTIEYLPWGTPIEGPVRAKYKGVDLGFYDYFADARRGRYRASFDGGVTWSNTEYQMGGQDGIPHFGLIVNNEPALNVPAPVVVQAGVPAVSAVFQNARAGGATGYQADLIVSASISPTAQIDINETFTDSTHSGTDILSLAGGQMTKTITVPLNVVGQSYTFSVQLTNSTTGNYSLGTQTLATVVVPARQVSVASIGPPVADAATPGNQKFPLTLQVNYPFSPAVNIMFGYTYGAVSATPNDIVFAGGVSTITVNPSFAQGVSDQNFVITLHNSNDQLVLNSYTVGTPTTGTVTIPHQ